MNSARHDAFLCYNSADQPAVEELARRLVEGGLNPWLDTWNLIPGEPWQEAIEDALAECVTCAVFIGPSGASPWQHEEMRAAITRRVSEDSGQFRVIPVLLPGAERTERSRLPAFLVATTWVEFRSAVDDEEAFRRLLAGIRGVEPGPGPEPVYVGECPYRGLQVFDVGHAPFFCGREALTEWLLNDLRPSYSPHRDNRFLAVIGPSGSGKSSLGRAGLIAALQQGVIAGSDTWPVVICRPGPDPLESLAVALAGERCITSVVSVVSDLIRELRDNERTLHLTTRLALRGAPTERRLVLLVDQLEELFTLCHDEQARTALLENLLYAAGVAGGQTIVILTLRADFYGKCAGYPALAAALSDHQVLVGPMTDDELRRAIERPAQLVGCEFEPGLVDTLLDDVRGQPGYLPLLQHALLELWGRRVGRRLPHAAYHAIGGVEGALEQRAELVYSQFSEQEQQICRRVFLRLTQPGEGTEDTRRRAPLDEILPANGEDGAIAMVIRTLADADVRLITTESGQDLRGEQFVEVAHEALIRAWPRLHTWIEQDRAALRIHRRLTETAHEWVENSRDASYLYQGARLAVVEEWAAARVDDMNDLERAFVAASVALQEQAVAEREASRQRELETARRLAETERARAGSLAKATSRLRWLVTVITLIALVYPGLLAYQQILRIEARDQMIHIAAARAVIGANGKISGANDDPVWTADVAAFAIEPYEVTNSRYRLCVMAGACTKPGNVSLYEAVDRSEHPVVTVSAFQAADYCSWVGRRLPTELEWELAARGPQGRSWPWGEDPPGPTRLNIHFDTGSVNDTRPVGSYAAGATPEHSFDMAGNVWEWTTTLFMRYPYQPDQAQWDRNNTVASTLLVIRGGGWDNKLPRLTMRSQIRPAVQFENVGFRCAR